jgi:hypothetical protein
MGRSAGAHRAPGGANIGTGRESTWRRYAGSGSEAAPQGAEERVTMTEARGSAGLNGTAHAPGTPCWVSLMVHGMAATQ